MAEGFHIASAYVTVSPDTDGFYAQLQADLSRYDITLKVPISPDVPADFMAQAEAEIRAQGDGAVKVPVDPEALDWAAKLQAAVNAGEAGVKGHPIEVPVDANANTLLAGTADAIQRARVLVAGTDGVIIPVSYSLNEGSFARTIAAADALTAASTGLTGSLRDTTAGLDATAAAQPAQARSHTDTRTR